MFDNCEHLVEACAALAENLLQACPNLKILATSREALGIAGEILWSVSPLSTPDPVLTPSLGTSDLKRYEATVLFIDRATSAEPNFTVTEGNSSTVAQICIQLDGIPLALELAAARVKVLAVEQIQTRLDDRFRLLTGGSRTATPRQQALKATIDWSYNLLSKEEQLLLGRLSVFMGGWTLEGSEQICAGDGIQNHKVLDLLTSLVDKSLVMVGEKKRYRMLETIRHYAWHRLLESGEESSFRDRHLEWYLDLSERSEPELHGADQLNWLDQLETEHDNFRAALGWSLKNGEVGADHDAPLRLAGALATFWLMRCYYSEGREWLEEALSQSSDTPVSVQGLSVRAKALFEAGGLALAQSDNAPAAELLEESLALYREIGEVRDVAWPLMALADISISQGDGERATALLEESTALFREFGNKGGLAHSLRTWGYLIVDQGDYARATALLEESIILSREVGDKWSTAWSLWSLGMAAQHQGDYEKAQKQFEDSLALYREVGNKWGIAASLGGLGDATSHKSDHGRAKALLEESLALFQETGDNLGYCYCIEGLAGVATFQGESERAVRLFAAAQTLREVIGSVPWSLEHDLESLRSELGEETYEAAWAVGRGLTLDQAIDLALASEDD